MTSYCVQGGGGGVRNASKTACILDQCSLTATRIIPRWRCIICFYHCNHTLVCWVALDVCQIQVCYQNVIFNTVSWKAAFFSVQTRLELNGNDQHFLDHAAMQDFATPTPIKVNHKFANLRPIIELFKTRLFLYKNLEIDQHFRK